MTWATCLQSVDLVARTAVQRLAQLGVLTLEPCATTSAVRAPRVCSRHSQAILQA